MTAYYIPRPGSKVHSVLAYMCKQPDRVYSSAEIAACIGCPLTDLYSHMTRLLQNKYVVRTKSGPGVRDQGYKVVRVKSGKLPIDLTPADSPPEPKAESTLSVLGSGFETTEIEVDGRVLRVPKVPRSIFEVGRA